MILKRGDYWFGFQSMRRQRCIRLFFLKNEIRIYWIPARMFTQLHVSDPDAWRKVAGILPSNNEPSEVRIRRMRGE